MNNNEGDSSSSPPLRSNILSSFLRGRPRAAQLPTINTDPESAAASGAPTGAPTSPTIGGSQPHHRHASPSGNHHHSNSNTPASATTTNNNNMSNGGASTQGLSQILRRRRSANNVSNATPSAPTPSAPLPISTHPSGASLTTALPTPIAPTSPGLPLNTPPAVGGSPIHRIRLVPQLESRRSLRFDPITRTVKSGDPVLRIGRFTDRSGQGLASLANATSSSKLAFRSKVVSRAHAEIWVDNEGKFWIKDTKSSSGTFLNHVRLSLAGQESRGFVVRDGDVVQLGVDYQGGTEDIYKCVKIRVEIGRDWQRAPNTFNTNAMKNLKAIAVLQDGGPKVKEAAAKAGNGKTVGLGLPDCCICLFPVAIRQALFLAPCSHTFHYKCIRPIIVTHYPAFSCPLCRTFADLEEDVEHELDEELAAFAEKNPEEAEVGGRISEEDEPEEVGGVLIATGGNVTDGEDVGMLGTSVRDRDQVHHVEPGVETEVETEFGGLGPRRRNGGVSTVVERGRGGECVEEEEGYDVEMDGRRESGEMVVDGVEVKESEEVGSTGVGRHAVGGRA